MSAMRSISHWSPRYIKNRLGLMIYNQTRPHDPWLTQNANEILDSWLKDTDVGVEFGSGRSTRWFAKRMKHITSVEHHEGWYEKVGQMFKDWGLENIDYRLCPLDAPEDQGEKSAYASVLDEFDDNSIDFILNDGQYRDAVAMKAIPKLKSGGVMVIDNVNWYLPSNTYSPASRSMQDGPNGKVWKEFHDATDQWRVIWTSSGVWDTAFFFKP